MTAENQIYEDSFESTKTLKDKPDKMIKIIVLFECTYL